LGTYYNSTWTNYWNIYLKDEAEFPLYLRVVTPDKTPIDITIKRK
jgi:hypothetical protein